MTKQRKPRHTAQTVAMLSPHGNRHDDVPRNIAANLTGKGWQIIPGTIRTTA